MRGAENIEEKGEILKDQFITTELNLAAFLAYKGRRAFMHASKITGDISYRFHFDSSLELDVSEYELSHARKLLRIRDALVRRAKARRIEHYHTFIRGDQK